MSRKFLTPIDMTQLELLQPVAHNLASAPSTPVKGQFYMNTTDNTLYWWDGTAWQAAKSGTPTLGNVTAETTFGTASNNGIATSVSRSDHQHGNPAHDSAAHSAIPLSALAVPTGPVSMNGQKLTNVGTPTAGSDATNKDYVDNLSAGLSWKEAVRVASTANVTIATGLNSGDVIDGVTLANGDRVLLKNQTAPAENGIYIAGVTPTRALDMDAAGEAEGAAVLVMEGTAHADQAWVMTTNAPITLGTTGLVWVQFGGGTAITAGAGLTGTTTFDVVATNASLLVNANDIGVQFASSGGDAGASVQPARGDHAHSTLYVPVARSISTTLPLTGGGDLSANRTLAVNTFASGTSGIVPASGGSATNFLSADGTWKAVPLDTTAGDVRYGRKFSQSVGGATSVAVVHNLGTRDVTVNVYRVASPYDTIECDVERTDTNTVTVRFAVAPAASEYRVVVIG